MNRLGEIIQGVRQFSRTGNPENGSVNLPRELAWIILYPRCQTVG